MKKPPSPLKEEAFGTSGRSPSPGEAEDPDRLRTEAEKKLAERKASSPAIHISEAERLIHELQVHQIELEMQNEALREARIALEESHDNLLDLYEFAPVGYLTLSKTAVIMEMNLTGAALLGIDRQHLIKDRFRKFVAPEDLERWDRYFIAAQHSAEKTTSDLKFLKRDGSRFNSRVESLLVERANKDPVIRMAIIDITAQKRAEDELIRRSDYIRAENEELTTAGDEMRRNEALLTESLEEKEALLSEVHHRVKNNLTAFISILALDGTYDESPAGERLRKDLQNRARSMALIHETLYKTGKFANVDMNVYLSTLTQQVAVTHESVKSIRTIVDVEGISLDLSRATPCGLIINELITNSFKYAFPPSFNCKEARREPCTIRISLALSNGYYQLVVADNGVGLPENFDITTANSLGLKLVNFLARHQLRAKVEVSRKNGTEFTIRFKEKMTRK